MQIARRLGLLLLLLASVELLILPSQSAGMPVTFNLSLTVNSAVCPEGTGPPCLSPPCPFPDCWNPRPAVGRTYGGFFTVDDDVLSKTGINSGTLTAFSIQIENIIWDAFVGHPPGVNNQFVGFRGPIPGCSTCGNFELFAPSPGFDVENGTIVALVGGVFGGADFPFVDFLSGSFGANDGTFGIEGTLAVSRVPQLPSFALFGLGLILVGVSMRRRFKIPSLGPRSARD